MSGKFASRTEIWERVVSMHLADARIVLANIVDVLYGPDANDDWSADETDAIAGLLQLHKLIPDEKEK